MRIVGGSLGGRRFFSKVPDGTRPTSEKVREGISAALHSRALIDGANVLELFAGTGAFSFEMLSRGASRALLVEKNPRVHRGIARSIKELELSERAKALRADVERVESWADRVDFEVDLLFADPPYADVEKLEAVLSKLLVRGTLSPSSVLVIESAKKNPFSFGEAFTELGTYRYGDTVVAMGRRT